MECPDRIAARPTTERTLESAPRCRPDEATDPSETVSPNPDGGSPLDRVGDGAQSLTPILEARLVAIGSEVKAVKEGIAGFAKELERLRTDDRVLTEMHDRCRTLSERFHEREVLDPVFLCLIGILDRCDQETRRIEEQMKKASTRHSWARVAIVGYLLQARNADRLEVGNLLANHGVVAFEHPDERFDPAFQRCTKRVETSRVDHHQRIAERVRPGYRRGDKIIRPECVSVYVARKSPTVKPGDPS